MIDALKRGGMLLAAGCVLAAGGILIAVDEVLEWRRQRRNAAVPALDPRP